MKKINKVLCLLLAVVVCLVSVQPVSAKTKYKYSDYNKTEKYLAYALAWFQYNELSDPDSFKIKKISKVKYTLDKEHYEEYDYYGYLDDNKTISWKVDFTAYNDYGKTVRGTVYASSTGLPLTDNDIMWEDYTDHTNYAKSCKSKKFVKKIKELETLFYYAM